MNWRRSVLLKKLLRYTMAVPRQIGYLARERSPSRDGLPPVIVNSFPKSGTHLLVQILQVIPGLRDWGLFLASMPSFTYRMAAPAKMAQKINKLASHELVSAHLHYSEEVAAALSSVNAVHFFIYRDLRDVAISEAHYLTYMNRWHALHPQFKELPDDASRIEFSLRGLSGSSTSMEYPDIGTRFRQFEPWLNEQSVLGLRYEDLMSDSRERVVERILKYYLSRSGVTANLSELKTMALDNISSTSSHTFRVGECGQWRSVFTEQQKALALQKAGSLLQRHGFELQ